MNLVNQKGIIQTINKPCRIAKKIVTSIDHVTTNSCEENIFRTTMIKSDVSDIFLSEFLLIQKTYLQKMKGSISIK